MSDKITIHSLAKIDLSYYYEKESKYFSKNRNRRLVVEAALDLIRAEAFSGSSNKNDLNSNMKELSKYADQIEEALKVKE